MFDAIFWLGNKIHAGMIVFKTLLAKLFRFAFAQFFIFIGLLKMAVVAVSTIINKAYLALYSFMDSDRIDGNSLDASAFSSYLDVANTVFPLTELFAFTVVLVGLWMTASIYRFLKSWLPTVN